MDKQRELNLPKRNTVLNSDLIANVRNCIVLIRDTPVISDADVAALYGVETKRVNEAVRNNPDKFPQDYMFELTLEEVDILRSKFSTTKLSSKSRVLPKVFTEKSTLELNFFIGKIKHTVKRVKKSRESGETNHEQA